MEVCLKSAHLLGSRWVGIDQSAHAIKAAVKKLLVAKAKYRFVEVEKENACKKPPAAAPAAGRLPEMRPPLFCAGRGRPLPAFALSVTVAAPVRPPQTDSMKPPPKESVLLGLLDPGEREKLLLQCATRKYARGEQIVREMENSNNMYFIERGKVRVTLFSRDGREVSFADLQQGENFGEMSVIDSKPRSANVIALTETDITIMPSAVFRRILHEHPAVALELLRQLTAMIRRLCDRIFEFSTIGVNNRIHAELLRLARKNLDLDGIARIPNVPTHAQFASRVSCHREAVSRELKALEKRGILQKKNRKLIVPKIALLQEMVDHVMGR